MLAARLGIDYDGLLNPISDAQQWFDQIAQTAVMGYTPEGLPMPVAQIEQEDLDRYGVTGEPRPGIRKGRKGKRRISRRKRRLRTMPAKGTGVPADPHHIYLVAAAPLP